MAGWPELTGPVEEVATTLLGAVLHGDGVALRVTEVEAYAGPGDPASHAHRGRTRRNDVMHGPAGRLYCYFTYGMHVCANVVTGTDGTASAVLLRGGEVVEGLGEARSRRPGVPDVALARGPANLCRALGVGLDHDGTILGRHGGPMSLALPTTPVPVDRVSWGPRVGVRLGASTLWRCWLSGDPTVSAYRRHPRAEPGTTRS